MSKNIFHPLLTLSIILYCFSQVQASGPDSLRALRISETIIIDGDLDEDAWEEAEEISNFTQRRLSEGEPASEKTEVAILYNETHLYIGVSAYDSDPEGIIAKESVRDFNWGSEDNFEIILGPYNDNRRGYLFVINPNGAMADVLITEGGSGFNKDWNGVWQAAVESDEEGWFAEIEIPFSSLSFPEKEIQTWALNMERNIRRKNEQVLWQGWSRDHDLESLAQAGRLVGLSGIRSASKWEIKPYLTAGLAQKNKLDGGADINYQLSPTMKLNFTLNTDFSQVEADREEINLSRFSLFFPEKRDFFLEGKNLFEFNLGSDVHAFYSRRIGLFNRKEVPLIAGARVVGKAGGSNIGALSIQSAAKDSLSSTNFSVLRLKQDIWEESSVGIILTSATNDQNHNFLYGADFRYRTSELFDDKNFEIGVALSQSLDSKQSNKNNSGFYAYTAYPNDRFFFHASASRIMKDYNPGVGFLRRNDYKLLYSELEITARPDWFSFVESLPVKPFEVEYYLTDHSNDLESLYYEFSPLGIEFTSGDNIEFNIQRFYDRLDESFEIVDDVEIDSDEYWFTRYELGAETFEGRRLFSELQYSWGDFYTGKRQELEISMGLNIHERFNLSADWERNYIKLDTHSFTTDEIGSRIEYAFGPKLTTSIYNQWNNEDDEMIINFRVNWIPKTGSYFYFVVNQEYSTNATLYVLNTTILTKLTWLFSF